MKTKNIITLRLLMTVFVCTFCIDTAAADQAHEICILKTSNSIKLLSQKITKAYFYKQQGVRPDHAEKDMRQTLVQLEKDIAVLQDEIPGEKEEENIISFLNKTLEELLSTLSEPYSRKNGTLMLDYSESLLEGAAFLADRHLQENSPEEQMLATTGKILFLLERINKYYIAHKVGFNDYNSVVQLNQAVTDIDIALAAISAYKKYPENLQASVMKINEFWPLAKEFYVDIQKGTLPVIVLASTEKLEKQIKIIEDYHHKAAGK